MSRWFRFYAEAIRNPKVMRLSDKDFRVWVKLLAVAAENDGAIPPLEDLKHILSMRLDHLSSSVDRLISGGLIDALAGGYEPHNWSKFQYKSDTSTARVTKHRAKGNVSETPPDTETDIPLSKDNGAKPAERVDLDAQFWSDAKSFLARRGQANPGALVGKWVKAHGKPETARALTEAQLERPADVVAFIEGCMRRQPQRVPAVPL